MLIEAGFKALHVVFVQQTIHICLIDSQTHSLVLYSECDNVNGIDYRYGMYVFSFEIENGFLN